MRGRVELRRRERVQILRFCRGSARAAAHFDYDDEQHDDDDDYDDDDSNQYDEHDVLYERDERHEHHVHICELE